MTPVNDFRRSQWTSWHSHLFVFSPKCLHQCARESCSAGSPYQSNRCSAPLRLVHKSLPAASSDQLTTVRQTLSFRNSFSHRYPQGCFPLVTAWGHLSYCRCLWLRCWRAWGPPGSNQKMRIAPQMKDGRYHLKHSMRTLFCSLHHLLRYPLQGRTADWFWTRKFLFRLVWQTADHHLSWGLRLSDSPQVKHSATCLHPLRSPREF